MKEFSGLQGKILVADDEKVNVDFFKVMLSKIGFDVEVAYDGQEVLDKVEPFSPDLIILDLLMPKISGFDVAKILKKEEKTKEIPILVLSAVSDVKEKVDLLGIGIEDYITKPFNFIEIIARIRNILKAKALKGEVELRRKDSKLLGELDVAMKHFLARAPAQAEEVLSSLEALRAERDEQFGRALARSKELLESVKALQNSYGRFLASYGEETPQSADN